MNRYFSNFKLIVIFLVAFATVFSCSKTPNEVTEIYFTNVQNGKLTLSQGESFKVKYLVGPYEFQETAEITWSSSNKNVAAVNKRGTITAQSPGKAVITAMSGNASAKVEVRVTELPTTSFSLPTQVDVYVGKTVAVSVSDLEPQGTSIGTIAWSVDKPEVANVAVDGGTLCVTATSSGSANLVGLCENGFKQTCKLNVTEYIKPQTVTLSCGTSSLEFKGQTQISMKVTPSNASVVKPQWSVTPSDIVSFDENSLIVKAGDEEGQVTVFTIIDGVKSNELKISVIPPRPANCYIVSEPGDYSFKAVKGNSTTSVGSVAKVEVLWEQPACNKVNPFQKGTVIEDVWYSDGMIHYTIAEGVDFGNALIAAKNSSGSVLWSWHIWYQPEIIAEQTYPSGVVMMDRNLGAQYKYVEGKTQYELPNYTCGLLYQWGRKDPFIASSSLAAGIHIQPVVSDSQTGTIAYSIQNPLTFIATYRSPDGDYTRSDWFWNRNSSDAINRWGVNKTIYDPCPAGWKVPPKNAWNGLTDCEFVNVYESFFNIKVGAQTICFPVPYVYSLGIFKSSGKDVMDTTWKSFLWSSESSKESNYVSEGDHTYAHGFYVGAWYAELHDQVKPFTDCKARGHMVRCCRE